MAYSNNIAEILYYISVYDWVPSIVITHEHTHTHTHPMNLSLSQPRKTFDWTLSQSELFLRGMLVDCLLEDKTRRENPKLLSKYLARF